jgi:dTDP-4-dehydrorhamnose 3,5-epimerase
MDIQTTFIPGLLIIKPSVFTDNRGYFYEGYNQDRYAKNGIDAGFIQDNLSYSIKGSIRGLHYQLAPFAQSKLVQVLKGTVIDVAVDIRKGSPTFGKHFAIELSQENKLQFLIPQGFAHGFSVLSDEAIFHYKCDNEYNKECERGINYNDSTLNIDWKVDPEKAIVSPKDSVLPSFLEADMNFFFAGNE